MNQKNLSERDWGWRIEPLRVQLPCTVPLNEVCHNVPCSSPDQYPSSVRTTPLRHAKSNTTSKSMAPSSMHKRIRPSRVGTTRCPSSTSMAPVTPQPRRVVLAYQSKEPSSGFNASTSPFAQPTNSIGGQAPHGPSPADTSNNGDMSC